MYFKTVYLKTIEIKFVYLETISLKKLFKSK